MSDVVDMSDVPTEILNMAYGGMTLQQVTDVLKIIRNQPDDVDTVRPIGSPLFSKSLQFGNIVSVPGLMRMKWEIVRDATAVDPIWDEYWWDLELSDVVTLFLRLRNFGTGLELLRQIVDEEFPVSLHNQEPVFMTDSYLFTPTVLVDQDADSVDVLEQGANPVVFFNYLVKTLMNRRAGMVGYASALDDDDEAIVPYLARRRIGGLSQKAFVDLMMSLDQSSPDDSHSVMWLRILSYGGEAGKVFFTTRGLGVSDYLMGILEKRNPTEKDMDMMGIALTYCFAPMAEDKSLSRPGGFQFVHSVALAEMISLYLLSTEFGLDVLFTRPTPGRNQAMQIRGVRFEVPESFIVAGMPAKAHVFQAILHRLLSNFVVFGNPQRILNFVNVGLVTDGFAVIQTTYSFFRALSSKLDGGRYLSFVSLFSRCLPDFYFMTQTLQEPIGRITWTNNTAIEVPSSVDVLFDWIIVFVPTQFAAEAVVHHFLRQYVQQNDVASISRIILSAPRLLNVSASAAYDTVLYWIVTVSLSRDWLPFYVFVSGTGVTTESPLDQLVRNNTTEVVEAYKRIEEPFLSATRMFKKYQVFKEVLSSNGITLLSLSDVDETAWDPIVAETERLWQLQGGSDASNDETCDQGPSSMQM